MLEQRGDHACSEWNDQGCLFGGQRRGMTVAEILLLVSGYYSDAHGCSNQTIQVYIGLSSFSSSFGLRLYGDGKSMLAAWCGCKYYNDSQCIATSPLELLFFISFLTQIFFYFSFDATYYIAFHTLVAPNIMFNFH